MSGTCNLPNVSTLRPLSVQSNCICNESGSERHMLILNSNDVRRCLPMSDAIEGMKKAFASLHRNEVIMPPRTHMAIAAEDAISLIMPSYFGGEEKALAVKVVGIFPNNEKRDIPRILGAVNVFDPNTGAPLAVLDGAMLTGIRTAAVSGAATDLLARADSKVLAVLGAGVQARTHIEAMCSVRSFEQIRIFSRTSAKAELLADQVQQSNDFSAGISADISVSVTADNAVAGSDIVCCTTSSSTPVFSDNAISQGTHINAVGSSTPCDAEVPASTVLRSRVFVDQLEAAFEEAGDLLQPIESGLISRAHILAELGELATGSFDSARSSPTDITFFKSVGLAMQDAFAAKICLENAVKLSIGQRVDW